MKSRCLLSTAREKARAAFLPPSRQSLFVSSAAFHATCFFVFFLLSIKLKMFHQHFEMHPGSVKRQANVESQRDSFPSSKFLTLIRIPEHEIYITPLISALCRSVRLNGTNQFLMVHKGNLCSSRVQNTHIRQ